MNNYKPKFLPSHNFLQNERQIRKTIPQTKYIFSLGLFSGLGVYQEMIRDPWHVLTTRGARRAHFNLIPIFFSPPLPSFISVLLLLPLTSIVLLRRSGPLGALFYSYSSSSSFSSTSTHWSLRHQDFTLRPDSSDASDASVTSAYRYTIPNRDVASVTQPHLNYTLHTRLIIPC